MKIGQILKEQGHVTDEQIDEALAVQEDTSALIGQILTDLGYVTENQVLEAWGEQIEVPFTVLSGRTISPDVLTQIPRDLADQYNVIPVAQENGQLEVAMADPQDLDVLDELSQLISANIEPVIGNPTEISSAIDRFYSHTKTTKARSDVSNKSASENSVIRLVDDIIQQAIKERASDIHIEPEEDELVIRYRIDGVMYRVASHSVELLRPVASRVKVMAQLDIAEHRRPQDGKLRRNVAGKDIDMRVSVLPTSYGEGVVIRILDKDSLLLGLGELGYNEACRDNFEQLITRSHGLILVTGPTGSGKTTTLYAALNKLNGDENKIITIEDPIEYDLRGIQQIQTHPKIGLDFATGLRSVLRHDPDIILVGEIRDAETAQIAIQSALTGHLVFATLHTNNASGAVTRLLDMGIENYLVASSVIGILAQRLVRKVCPKCQLEEPFTFGDRFDTDFKGTIKRGTGCDHCKQTGYRDRTAIVENLVVTDAIKDLIKQSATSSDIQKVAQKEGMKTLREDGLDKVKVGITTPEEVLRVANT